MSHSVVSWLPVWITLLPLVGTGLIYVVEQRSWKWRNGLTVIVSALTCVMVAAMYPYIARGQLLTKAFPDILPPLGLSFRVDPVAFLMAAIIALVWLAVAVYSLAYMVREHHKKRYYPFLTLILGGSLGVVLAGDLFTFFVFFEFMSLASYVLIIQEQTPEAMKAGYKYLIMTICGSLLLFFGIISVFELAGTLTLGTGGIIGAPSNLALGAFIAFVLGFGIKAGIFPLHVWLPDAHPVAPSPASALLSGLLLKVGAYGFLRIVYNVYGIELLRRTHWLEPVVYMAVISILLGSCVAILQDDLKRRLAYSSVGQMGYIMLGIAVLSERALFGAIFHIFSHAFMKAALFLVAGAFAHKTGKRYVSQLEGIGMRMPLTLGAFGLASLSMVGIPPLAGYLSKWQLSVGMLDVGRPWLVVVMLLSSLMNAVYLFPVVINGFFGADDSYPEFPGIRWENETDVKMLVPILVLAGAILVFAIYPNSLPFSLSGFSARYLFQLGGW